MKNRIGSLVIECTVALGVLCTLVAGFAVMTNTFTGSRAALLEQAEQRIVLESIGEKLLALDYQQLDPTIQQFNNIDPNVRIESELASAADIEGVRITLKHANAHRATSTLVLWRFPSLAGTEQP